MNPRRHLCAIALAVFAVSGFVLHDPSQLRISVAEPPIEAVAMPSSDVVSATWFCAGGVPADSTAITGTPDDDAESGAVEDKVFIANVAATTAVVRVNALSRGTAPRSKDYTVAAYATIGVAVSDVSNAPDAALIVEAFSSGVVVEQLVKVPGIDDAALAPCATSTSSSWYFAAGSTSRGSSQWLSLLNPYSDDAVVDITVVLEGEVRKPSDLQSLVVGARSRRSLFINDAADRQGAVALIINVAGGSGVVAQQTIVHPRRSERRGVSSSLGAIAPSTRFTFAGGSRSKAKNRVIYVLNPGPVATDVDIQVIGEGATPLTITVEAQSVEKLNVARLVPPGTQYSLVVQAAADLGAATGRRSERGIVVEDIERFDGFRNADESETTYGVASNVGGVSPSVQWAFGPSLAPAMTATEMYFYNPNEKAALIDVSFFVGGKHVRPESLQGVTIDGASRLIVSTTGFSETSGAMIVKSTSPIYAERLLLGTNLVTRVAGIPLRNS